MNVDSSICARPAKVCTTDWRRVKVVAVVDSNACVTLGFVGSDGIPSWPNVPILLYAPGHMLFMFMPYALCPYPPYPPRDPMPPYIEEL